MVLELGKAHHCSGNGACPDEDKETPSPIALFAHRNQGDRGIRAGNVPVDGGMIPFAQPLLPFAPGRDGVVGGRGDVRHQHAKQVEDDARRGPSVMHGEAPIQEDAADNNTQQNSTCMRPGVPKLLLVTEMYFEFHIALFLLFLLDCMIRDVCMIHDVCGAKILRNSEFGDIFRDCYDMDVIIWGIHPRFRSFYLLYLLDV